MKNLLRISLQNPLSSTALVCAIIFSITSGILATKVQDQLATWIWGLLAVGSGLFVIFVHFRQLLQSQKKLETEERARNLERKAFEERLRRIPVPGEAVPSTPRRALIALVSPGKYRTNAAREAALFHSQRNPETGRRDGPLEHLWLLYSPDPPPSPPEPTPEPKTPEPKTPEPKKEESDNPLLSSEGNAKRIKIEMEKIGTQVHLFAVDHYDAQEVFETAERIYLYSLPKHHISLNDTVANVTGGTKSMTIGLAMASIPIDREIEFGKPEGTTPEGHADHDYPKTQYLININFIVKTWPSLLVDPHNERAALTPLTSKMPTLPV